MGDDDGAQPVLALGRQVARVAQQHLDDPLDHLHHVGLALPQVGVLDGLELLDQQLHLLHQRPLGIGAAGEDEGLGGPDEHRVFEEHDVHAHEGVDLGGRRAGTGRSLQARQVGLDPGHRGPQPGDLGVHVLGRHGEVGDLEQGVGDQVGVADGDALGDGETVDGEAHGFMGSR